MIRAAALSYAIVFSLLTGLICSGVLFIAATQKKIEVLQTNKEHLIFDSYTAIRYGMYALTVGDSTRYIHPSGDTSIIRHQSWGAFSLITAETFKFPLLRQRSALTGVVQSPVLPCLYLPGNSTGLKITGNTRLEGTVFAPNAQVERAYIAGKNYTYNQLVFGKTEKSETGLPPLKPFWRNLEARLFIQNQPAKDYVAIDSVYTFGKPLTYYQQTAPIVLSNRISGNVVIHSFDSIYVEARAHLENVILIAPVVRFESGFQGSVQVLAQERIICEKEVLLRYPSVLTLNERKDFLQPGRRKIILDENSQVLGGILITTQTFDFRNLPFLEMHPGSLAAGIIYNSGESEVFGSVIGSLFTYQLSARTGGGMYGNHLVDALISQERLPDYFLLPGWLESQEKVKPKIIGWL